MITYIPDIRRPQIFAPPRRATETYRARPCWTRMFGWYDRDEELNDLHRRVARIVALEEALLVCLAESLHAHLATIPEREERETIRLILSRRISILKQQAVLASLGMEPDRP